MKKPQDTGNSEIPEKFVPKTDSFDYIRREEMIPMRDGVKLKTFILVPKDAHDAPIILTDLCSACKEHCDYNHQKTQYKKE